MNKFLKSTLAASIALTLISAPAFSATLTSSELSEALKGYQPFFPSVGVKVKLEDGSYYSGEEAGELKEVLIGDTLVVPVNITEFAKTDFYKFLDLDKDEEDKTEITNKITWYVFAPTTETELTNITDKVMVATGDTYTVDVRAAKKQIGFTITPVTTNGNPLEGPTLFVPDITKFGGQVLEGCDADNPTPETCDPEKGITTDPTDKPNPDIVDKNEPGVPAVGDFVVNVIDTKDGKILGKNAAFVNRQYKAEVWALTDAGYVNATEALKDSITWTLTDGTNKAEYMTAKGFMEVGDVADIESFDPTKASYTNDATVAARFKDGKNITFDTQVTNDGAISSLKAIGPNFSDQGFQLKVDLIVPEGFDAKSLVAEPVTAVSE